MFCRNPHPETERLNNAVTHHLGIVNTGDSLMLSFGTHLLGRLALTLTRVMWQFLELNLGMPTVSCPNWLLAVRFAAREISMFPPIKLLRAKVGHSGTIPWERVSPPQPTSAPPVALPGRHQLLLTFSQQWSFGLRQP